MKDLYRLCLLCNLRPFQVSVSLSSSDPKHSVMSYILLSINLRVQRFLM